MKLILLPCLLFAIPFICLSQTVTDTAKEVNDLKTLQAALIQESTASRASLDHQQALMDSLSAKYTTDSIGLAEIKQSDPVGHKTYLEKNEKKLQQLQAQIDQLTQKFSVNRTRNQAQLEKAAAILKEIDARLKELQTRPG
jgi:hypothetical protein